MDTFNKDQFDQEELLSVTALQGVVNKTKPRLMVTENSEEGAATWASGSFRVSNVSQSNVYQTLKKYASEADGVVLYDPGASPHYRNLAATVASLKNAIPMTRNILARWEKEGIQLTVVDDLTGLSYRTPVEIYTYLYENYWKDCTHRLILSQSPDNTYHMHDLPSAIGAATLYLDCKKADERALFGKFLEDMTPGQGIVLGWFTSERSGITTVSSYGLSTVPADFFNNPTVYSGLPHTIKTASVPTMPKLENKVYIMLVISDGDNIQYNQHSMRVKWDSSRTTRGKTAINWTVSPALADIAPNMLNYYYQTATDKDCLICGPSGLGYALLCNSLKEEGANPGNYMTDDEAFTEYVRLTDRYLERTGLRAVTLWDYASTRQLELYTAHAKYLWGLTTHVVNGNLPNQTQVVNDKLSLQLLHWYCGTMEEARSKLSQAVTFASRKEPSFVAIQLSAWDAFTPEKVTALEQELKKIRPNVEFLRADHFYALYNEAKGLPFDISLHPDLTVTADGSAKNVARLTDGSRTGGVWRASEAGKSTVTMALGHEYDLKRLVLVHAAACGLSPSLNTVKYTLEVSSDGENYTVLQTVSDNSETVNDLVLTATGVTHVRITIDDPGADGIARLADIELYGKRTDG